MDGEHEEHEHGAHSRVITADSYNAGQITYLSYGWQTDRSTVYETEVATATLGTASTVASKSGGSGIQSSPPPVAIRLRMVLAC
jgi:hypothetical protein